MVEAVEEVEEDEEEEGWAERVQREVLLDNIYWFELIEEIIEGERSELLWELEESDEELFADNIYL